jgi:hypothetical protein
MGFIPASYECDVCKIKKQSSNHWYFTIGEEYPSIVIRPFKEHLSGIQYDGFEVNIFCGTGCLIKWLSLHVANLFKSSEAAVQGHSEADISEVEPQSFEESSYNVALYDKYEEPQIPDNFDEYRKDLESNDKEQVSSD